MSDNKYHWLGVPIIQVPENLQAYQEIIWDVKPNLIIETGVKHGGSITFSASMLILLEECGIIEDGFVIGIDIKPRGFTHPLSKKILQIQGSSIGKNIIRKVHRIARDKKVLVFLDSNHSHAHVLAELNAYAPLVSIGSYIIVEDTGIEDISQFKRGRNGWSKGNNPKTAVLEFMKDNKNFIIDKKYNGHPQGFLRRVE